VLCVHHEPDQAGNPGTVNISSGPPIANGMITHRAELNRDGGRNWRVGRVMTPIRSHAGGIVG
jgi:hypothetical protein